MTPTDSLLRELVQTQIQDAAGSVTADTILTLLVVIEQAQANIEKLQASIEALQNHPSQQIPAPNLLEFMRELAVEKATTPDWHPGVDHLLGDTTLE